MQLVRKSYDELLQIEVDSCIFTAIYHTTIFRRTVLPCKIAIQWSVSHGNPNMVLMRGNDAP